MTGYERRNVFDKVRIAAPLFLAVEYLEIDSTDRLVSLARLAVFVATITDRLPFVTFQMPAPINVQHSEGLASADRGRSTCILCSHFSTWDVAVWRLLGDLHFCSSSCIRGDQHNPIVDYLSRSSLKRCRYTLFMNPGKIKGKPKE